MKIAIIDNYDSFTYNLVHLVEELGAEVAVMRNDQFQLPDLASFDKILLSPGPGIPSEAGLLPGVIREYAARKSILGVCLGHQAIAEAFGARLENLSDVLHGIATPCRVLQADRLYSGLLRQVCLNNQIVVPLRIVLRPFCHFLCHIFFAVFANYSYYCAIFRKVWILFTVNNRRPIPWNTATKLRIYC